MTYSSGNKIVASDYNSFKDTFNGLWGNGSSTTYGYGQSAVSGVTAGNKINASDWATLVDNLKKVLNHQGTAYTPMTTPTAGAKSTAITSLSPNYILAESASNRFNSASVGDTLSSGVNIISSSSFNKYQRHTVTASFGSHDKARYFFNAGGQLEISCFHDESFPANDLSMLARNIGRLRLGAGSTDRYSIPFSQKIGGVTYPALSSVGGNFPAYNSMPGPDGFYGQIWNSGIGFYNLRSGYDNLCFLSMNNKSPPAQISILGGYDQAGTFTFIMDSYNFTGGDADAPAGLATVPTGSKLSVFARQPPTTYLTNSWGPIAYGGTVTQTSVAVKRWYFYSTSTTATVPAGTTQIRMIIIGAGGGGETATGVTIRGGGGGGAGQVIDTTISVNPYQGLIIGVGAGGPGASGYFGFGFESSVQIVGGTTITASGGGTVGSFTGTLGQGGQSGSGYTGGPAYGYGRIYYGGGGGGGSNYYGFAAGQAGTVTQASGGIGGVGVTIGPINGSYYNVGGGGEGGMTTQLINWTLTDETGYKYGGGRGGVYVGNGGHAAAGTGGGGGGGAQNTSSLNVIGGNGGSGFVAIYM